MADTKEEILQRLLDNLPDEYDKSLGSFFYDVQAPLAIEHEEVYKKIDEILDKGFAKTSSGIYLDRKAEEQGLVRKSATFADGTVTISGSVGAVIKIGDKVSSDYITFTISETKTIPEGGTIDVKITADTAGTDGNLPVGAIKTFPVTLSGLISVTNLAPTTGGYNEETDDELRARYFEKVSSPAASGNKYHYSVWAKEVTGVGDVKVIPLWNGAGTVKVIIINSEKQAAEQSLIDEVAEKIESNRPIGADVTVVTAVSVTINISVTLTLDEGLSADTVRPKIENAVSEYLKKTAFKNSYVSVAHIGSSILFVDGVLDFTDLTVNGGTDNIPVTDEQVAALGVISIVV